MKVALVHDYLREYGGAERVLEVLHSMFPEAPIYTSYFYPDALPKHFREMKIIPGAIQSWPFSKQLQKPYTYFVGMSFEQLDLREYDLIISSSANFAKGVLTHPGQVHINYCHTPTRFLWGLNTQTKRSGIVKVVTNVIDSYLRQWDFAAAQRVDYFIANSKTTQKRIKQFYQRDSVVLYPFCLRSLPLPVSDTLRNSVISRYNLPKEYYLVVSRLFRVKHVDFLVSMANELQFPLVVVGTGKESAYLHSIAGKNIVFTGFVSDDALSVIYAGARGFLAAAEDEDFGMTVVEAQSYGLPVLALRAGGYVETVVDGKSGLFFDSLSSTSFHTRFDQFHNMTFDSEFIRHHSLHFSEDRFIERMRTIIEEKVQRVKSSD